jgi:tRNA A-37 threonylcarbamoyl transferase component Bud32
VGPDIPKPGERIGRKWVVEGTLGVGGMGVVLAAVHADIGQRVAIKLLLPHLARETAAAERLMREARAVVSLHSEHATRIYDVDRDDRGVPYIVMERLEGMDFDRLLKMRGVLPVPEAVDCILEACEAVAEAHARGLVHRDLKPANLFLARRADGTQLVKVLDFGISKSLLPESDTDFTLTQTDHALGSPRYMSPEQLRNSKTVDHRSDIWSLGIILYRIVSGRAPFEAETIHAYLWRVAVDPPTPLSQLLPGASTAFTAVLERCMQKDAQDRPQSVAELASALAPFGTLRGQASLRSVLAFARSQPASLAHADRRTPAPPPPGDATASAWTPGGARPKPASARGLLLAGAATFVVVLGVGWLGLRRMGTEVQAPSPSTAAAPAPSGDPAASGDFPAGDPGSPAAAPAPSDATAAGEGAPAGRHSASAAADEAPAPIAPGTVELEVTVEPREATLEVDGKRVQPGAVQVPRKPGTVRIVARAPGYVPQTRDVSAAGDGRVHLALKRAPASPVKPASPGPLETEL